MTELADRVPRPIGGSFLVMSTAVRMDPAMTRSVMARHAPGGSWVAVAGTGR